MRLLLLALLIAPSALAQSPAYPDAPRGDVRDDYFGTTVADPYRWMETMDDPDVLAWVDAQNNLSRPMLEALPSRAALVERLDELWTIESYGMPREEGGRYFYTYTDGTQDQSILYVSDDLQGDGRVLLDPNTLSDDATISLSGWSPSPDGKLLAYGLSDGGTDWRSWHLLDVATGEKLPDVIEGIKFSGVSWLPDGSGFYYSRYPLAAPTSERPYDDQLQPVVYLHVVGEPQSADAEVFRVTDHPTRTPYASQTEDGRFLVVNLFDGYFANGIYVQDLMTDSEPRRLLDAWDARYTFLGNDGRTFYFQTTLDAPNGKVIGVDFDAPERDNWTEIIAQSDEPLQGASYVGGHLVANYLRDVTTQIRLHDLDGSLVRTVDLPGLGSAGGFGGDADQTQTFYSFSSFTTPGAIYSYDIATGESALWKQAQASGIDPDDYAVEQVFYPSTDGIRIPMFIVGRKALERTGDTPTLLYGYGGFNVSLTPGYSASRMAWLERGGLLAIPNIRGGGEYGEAWHRAGTKLQKQNVFDDFIAAAQYLIDEGYTNPNKLAIQGGSNGGLLVGAVLLQRPDLFAAALPAVGVLDMLRYHTASANARQWSSDYGLSENEDEFAAQLAYSPVHNTQPGECYPATLVTTAMLDDRVVAWHSFKFAAALQHAQSDGCPNPILLRVETRQGHGAGTPRWMRIDQTADVWAFVMDALGMDG